MEAEVFQFINLKHALDFLCRWLAAQCQSHSRWWAGSWGQQEMLGPASSA